MSWSNKERKRKMRLNIIRHRQQLLKYLENVNDTIIKPKIKLNSSDLEQLNSNVAEQRLVLPVKIKKEEPIETCDTSDELISVGSNEGWNDSGHLTSDQVDPRRKSKRFDSINSLRKLSDNKNKDCKYKISLLIRICVHYFQLCFLYCAL